jgi:dCTP deaminase
VILSGAEIAKEVEAGRLVIQPFDSRHVEPNSYGFHLGSTILRHREPLLDARVHVETERLELTEAGLVLQPGRAYLCHTLERMGSPHYAATLYANRSTSCIGMWIQMSAPLGHTGAIIPWTLEVTVVHPLRVYPGMLVGKIAFWRPQGARWRYFGKYSGSRTAVESRLAGELELVEALRPSIALGAGEEEGEAE